MRMTQRYLYYLEGVLVALAALALVPARLETATQDRHALKKQLYTQKFSRVRMVLKVTKVQPKLQSRALYINAITQS